MRRIAPTISTRPVVLLVGKLTSRTSRQRFVCIVASTLCWTATAAALEYQVTGLGSVYSVPQNGSGLLSDTGRVGFNDYGQFTTGGGQYDYLYTPTVPNGTMFTSTLLASVDQSDYTVPLGLSNNGEVVGDYNPGFESAFAWIPTSPNATTGQFYIPSLNSNNFTIAYGVNNAGQIVGNDDGKAFLFNPTGIQFGQLMGTTTFLNTSGVAHGINSLGQVVGEGNNGPNPNIGSAFLFTPSTPNSATGTTITLGSLPGANYMAAYAVNNLGAVVGYGAYNTSTVGFIWTNADGLLNLNNLLDPVSGAGWTIASPLAINNAGQIVGEGLLNGAPQGFLLTPVPEPSTFAFAALGGMVLLAFWRRLA
jgi:hypothetical protein